MSSEGYFSECSYYINVADVDLEVDYNVVDVVGIWGSDNCYSNSEQM